jgi:hypothetical protein
MKCDRNPVQLLGCIMLVTISVLVGCENKPMPKKVSITDIERATAGTAYEPSQNVQKLRDDGWHVELWTGGAMYRGGAPVSLCGTIHSDTGVKEPKILIDMTSDGILGGGLPLPQLVVENLEAIGNDRFFFRINDCLDGRALKKGACTLNVKLAIINGPSFSAKLPIEVRNPDWSK